MLDEKINYKKMTNEELIKLYKLKGDEEAREILITKNKKLIYKAASQKKGVSLLDYEDLVQEGTIGLIVGIEKFDIKYTSKFSTYIYYWIKQRIDRAIYNTGTTIRLPIHLVNKINKILFQEGISGNRLMEKDIERICDELSITTSQYYSYKQLISQFKNIVSLNSIISDDGGDSDDELLSFISNNSNIVTGSVDKESHVEDYIMDKDLLSVLEDVLGTLKEREEKILRMRYGLDDGETKTLEQVGDIFNITRERIRQIEAKALHKLRNPKNLNKLKAYHYSDAK